MVMRCTFALLAILAAAVSALGCSARQVSFVPPVQEVSAQPLPFKGRLVDGDPGELPAAVAMSLSDNSRVTFSYREELTHDERHVPLIVSAFNPATYAGSPLGDFGVTAFASLSIFDGDAVLGHYTAEAQVSKSYSIYSEPTHREVDRAVRAEVRAKIDQQLRADRDRLARAADAPAKPAADLTQ